MKKIILSFCVELFCTLSVWGEKRCFLIKEGEHILLQEGDIDAPLLVRPLKLPLV